MSGDPAELPCPEFTVRIDVRLDAFVPEDVGTMPACSGLVAIEDGQGRTIHLTAASDLRAATLRALKPMGAGVEASGASARCTVFALPTGGAFEADWAFLQHARRRLPLTYRGLLDHWQAWQVKCDLADPFPEWIKALEPCVSLEMHVVRAGPFPSKHAAGRYLDLLTDAFDLCRYHHILAQAPVGKACAYKEMGRCAAPCDGSISMEAYRHQLQEAASFATTPVNEFRSGLELEMASASAALKFEHASRCRDLLERTAPAEHRDFRAVGSLTSFAAVSVQPAVRRGWARLFAIRGGHVQPWVDIRADASHQTIEETASSLAALLTPSIADFDEAGMEPLGMVCWHLFQPRRKADRAAFILRRELTPKRLQAAVRRFGRGSSSQAPAETHPAGLGDIQPH